MKIWLNDQPNMDKYKGKYHIGSTRMQNWDYGWNAAYFVTICTKDRKCFFGDIADAKMQLTHVGVLADVMWHEIKNHAKNVELDAFVVMPNHVHGIVILNGDADNTGNGNDVVETTHALFLPQSPPPSEPPKTIGQKRFQNQGKNTLSSIVGSYKSAVTKHAHRLGHDFAWQPRFHDHVIRDAASHERIAQYIINNVINWQEDTFCQKFI